MVSRDLVERLENLGIELKKVRSSKNKEKFKLISEEEDWIPFLFSRDKVGTLLSLCISDTLRNDKREIEILTLQEGKYLLNKGLSFQIRTLPSFRINSTRHYNDDGEDILDISYGVKDPFNILYRKATQEEQELINIYFPQELFN